MTETPNLDAGDAQAAAVQKTEHRVTIEQMKNRVTKIEYLHPPSNHTLTIAVVTIENGFMLVGKSAAADPDNFNADLGYQYAYEDALRQMWPLEAYLLRETLSKGAE